MSKKSVYRSGDSVFGYRLAMSIVVDWGVKQQTKQARFHLDLKYIGK